MSVLVVAEMSQVCGGICEAASGLTWVGCELGYYAHEAWNWVKSFF